MPSARHQNKGRSPDKLCAFSEDREYLEKKVYEGVFFFISMGMTESRNIDIKLYILRLSLSFIFFAAVCYVNGF